METFFFICLSAAGIGLLMNIVGYMNMTMNGWEWMDEWIYEVFELM